MKPNLIIQVFIFIIISSIVQAQTLLPYFASTTTSKSINDYLGINGTNVTAFDLGWANIELQKSIEGLYPSTIRYPGGTNANWWDWRKGGFVDGSKIDNKKKTCYGLPFNYGSIYPQNNNSLANFKISIDKAHAKPVFVLNLLSSTLSDQLAMLEEAQQLGFPIEEVELGNEFYTELCEHIEKYPTGTSYATDAATWTGAIRQRFGSNVKVSWVGAKEYTGMSSRLANWNSGMVNIISTLSASQKPDAFTLHEYKPANVPATGTSHCSTIDFTANQSTFCSKKIWQKFFYNVYKNIDAINTTEMTTLSAAFPAGAARFWFTEYNLLDREKMIHGSWANALYTGAMTLAFLDYDKIEHINCHTLFGNAIFSSIFSDNYGYPNFTGSDAFCLPDHSNPAPTTDNFSLTGLGHVLSNIGNAIKNAASVKKITFQTSSGIAPILGTCSATLPAVTAYEFTDVAGNKQIVLLNLSDQSVTISTSGTIPTGGTAVTIPANYQSISFAPYDYVYSTATSSSNVNIKARPVLSSGVFDLAMNDKNSNFSVNTFSGNATIAPYSITRFWQPVANSIKLVTQNNSVCEGSTVNLYAVGDPSFTSYEWYQGSTLLSTTILPSYQVTVPSFTSTYSVVATNTSSATFTSSVSIAVISKPTASITPTPASAFVCGANSVTLSATTGAYNYSWSPNEDIISGNPLSNSITVSPATTKDYTVYISNGTCSNKSTVTVRKLDDFNFDNVNDIVCTSVSNGALTLNAQPIALPSGVSATYAWSNSTTTLSTFAYPTNSNSANTYSVSVTYNYNGLTCNVIREKTIHRASCCNNGALVFNYGNVQSFLNAVSGCTGCTGLNVSNSSTQSTQSISGTTTSSIININGHLIIDENLTLYGMNLQMGEGAEIDIQPSRTLTLDNSVLKGCTNYLWEGIHVNGYGQLIVKHSNQSYGSSIQDARIAVETMDRGDVRINTSTLSNNYIGIYFNPSKTNRSTSDIYLTTFSSITGQSLKSPYGWMTERTGTKGFAGIYFNDAINTFGSSDNASGSHLNTFQNLHCGIYADRSILKIVNAKFDNIYSDAVYAEKSADISSVGLNVYSRLDVVGINTNNTPNYVGFSNSERGVYLQYSSASIKMNQMSNVDYGIDFNSSNENTLAFAGNHIDANKRGIQLLMVDGAAGCDLENNVITMHPSANNKKNIGMLIEGGNLIHSGASYSASCNGILSSNNNSFQGFIVNNISNVDVLNNTVHLPTASTLNTNAFGFDNLSNSWVRQNGADGNINYSKGLRFAISGNNLVTNNSTDNLNTGLEFSGYCFPTSLISNLINHHNVGLHLDGSSNIGPEINYGNQWLDYGAGGTNYSNGFGAVHDGNQAQVFASKFTVIGSQGSVIYPIYNTPNDPQHGWFTTLGGSTPIGNPFSPCARYSPYRTEHLSFIDSLVALEGIPSYEFEKEVNWMSRHELIERLLSDSVALLQNEFFRSFFDSIQASSLGQSAITRKAICEIYNDQDLATGIGLNDSLISDLLNQKALNDDLLHSGLSPSDSINAENLNVYYLNEISRLKDGNNSFIKDLNDDHASRARICKDLNSEIEPQNILEENEKTVNRIYLDNIPLNKLEIGEADQSALHEIANQCPLAGGTSVYTARAILHLLGDSTEYNDEEYCHSLGYRKGKTNQNILLLVQPNPASNQSSVLFSFIPDEQIRLEIYDVAGRAIKTLLIPEKTQKFTFNTSELTNGVYTLNCIGENIHLYSKLIISR